ncbi:MAG: hypothetical protein ACLF0G_00335 [Candidatus Brocadiia bacterium]
MGAKKHFWLGMLMLALGVGFLVGGLLWPRRAAAQQFEGGAEGRSLRYGVVTGVRGSRTRSQTVYVIDDTNEFLYILEYSSAGSAKDALEWRGYADLRLFALKGLKERAERERKGGGVGDLR